MSRLIFEDSSRYRKICIWKDEEPIQNISQERLSLCMKSGGGNGADRHSGTICVEALLNPHHCSFYAMISMKYVDTPKDKTEIFINYGRSNQLFLSEVLPFQKMVHEGMDKEFADAIYDFFEKYQPELPCGTIEIDGAYDEVGSSYVSFQKTMEILFFLFENADKLDAGNLRDEISRFCYRDSSLDSFQVNGE